MKIELSNVTLSIQQQCLINGATLRIGAGEKVVLRGPSGCGKSSLLKCIAGALPLDSGTIRVDDTELSADTAAIIRKSIAFIGQEPVLGADRVRDALLLPFTYKAHRHLLPDLQTVTKYLQTLHLSSDILDKPCARISGGEKQRIAIARALLLDKTIFLTDEITSALDPESKAAVMQELFESDITLLSVSHDSDWIERCSRVITMKDAQLKEETDAG